MGSQTPADNGVRIDDALRLRAEECARASGVSISEVVRNALEDYLATRGSRDVQPNRERSLSEIADSIAATVPADEWAKLPADLAKNSEYYRYGYPRED